MLSSFRRQGLKVESHMNQQQARADNDRRALRSWHEWEFRNGERRTVLCVETALEMRSGEPGFDADQLSLLIDEAMEMMRKSPSPIDAVRIVPERGSAQTDIGRMAPRVREHSVLVQRNSAPAQQIRGEPQFPSAGSPRGFA
jgi:hypothetical protein